MKQKKKKVLLAIPTLKTGGAERFICTLFKILDRKTFEISMIICGKRADVSAIFYETISGNSDNYFLEKDSVTRAIIGIAKHVQKTNPDIVFSTATHLNVALALTKSLWPKKTKLVARETSMISQTVLKKSKIWHLLYSIFLKKVNVLVCQSHSMLSDVRANFSLDTVQTHVIENPVEIEEIETKAQKPDQTIVKPNAENWFVTVGRLSPEKGYDLLVDAVSLLDDVSIFVTVVGDGPLKKQLIEKIRNRSLTDKIEFVGFQANPFPFLAQADAYVCSSDFEGMPNSVVEAMVCGLPVVSTPIDVCAEMLADIPGCVIASGHSSIEIANALKTWISGKKGRIDRSFVEPYSSSNISLRYGSLLKSV